MSGTVRECNDKAPIGVPTASTTSAACSWELTNWGAASTGTREVAGDTFNASHYYSAVAVPIYDRTVSGTGTQTNSVSLPAAPTGSLGVVRHDAAGVAQSVWVFPTTNTGPVNPTPSADGGLYITFNYDAASNVYPFSATGAQTGTSLSLPAPIAPATSAIAIVKFSALGVPTKAAVVQVASFFGTLGLSCIYDDPTTGKPWLVLGTSFDSANVGTATVYDFSSTGVYEASNNVTLTAPLPSSSSSGAIVRFSADGVAEAGTAFQGALRDVLQFVGDYAYVVLFNSTAAAGIPNMTTTGGTGPVVVTKPASVDNPSSVIVRINTRTGVIHSCAVLESADCFAYAYAMVVAGTKLYVAGTQGLCSTAFTIRDFGLTGGDTSATVTSGAGVGFIVEYDTVTGMATRCANTPVQIYNASACADAMIFSGIIPPNMTAPECTNYNLGLDGSTSASPVITPVGDDVHHAFIATIAYSAESGHALGLFTNPWSISYQLAMFNGPRQIVVTSAGPTQAGQTALPSMSVDGTPTTMVQYPVVLGGMASLQMLYTPRT